MAGSRDDLSDLTARIYRAYGADAPLLESIITEINTLITGGFDFNSEPGRRLFYAALTARRVELITVMLKSDAHPKGIDAAWLDPGNGETYLYSLADCSHEKNKDNNLEYCQACAAVLIQAGADPYLPRRLDNLSAYDRAVPALQTFIESRRPLAASPAPSELRRPALASPLLDQILAPPPPVGTRVITHFCYK